MLLNSFAHQPHELVVFRHRRRTFRAVLEKQLGKRPFAQAAAPDPAGARRRTVEDLTGVFLDWSLFRFWELCLLGGVTAIGAVAGLTPAVKGSMTQVADNLAQNY